ncbi:MAG TPA: 16S rRNA (cytosine(967)-C(5))-methyltransferase RsmB [Gemmatimonadaceae bacterium]|nr:16S rRNA (cytosine(967)-C(5))-methyltransferase RsmB [Gemmatimonadaceae bacterium]
MTEDATNDTEQPYSTEAAIRGGVTPARVIAADVCADIRSGYLLDPSFDRRTSVVDARDRRWIQELLYGMLRRRSWLDAILSDRVRGGLARLDPDLIDLLRLGAYQLMCMGSVPAYAAIAQTVELTKVRHGIGASKLANAVLRRTDRERSGLDVRTPADPVDALALTYSHPRWIVARWVSRWGADETASLLEANNTEAPVIVRPYGVVREQLEAMLETAGAEVHDAPLVEDSIRLGHGVALTELTAFTQGLFFVQDPAATLVTRYAAVEPGSVVADLCAAPGGKSFELARNAATVYAGDRSASRMQRVLATAKRIDAKRVFPFVHDARHPSLGMLDAVLVDVPCTGTGTFRRHPDARWRLKVSDLAIMSAIQRSIIRAAAAIVKPGGLLIYSTCSIEPEENDVQIEAFLVDHPEFVLEPPPEGAVPSTVLDAGRLRVLPHKHGTDGAFAARLRRVS